MAEVRELIGYVGVDSGQLIVVDPCYLGEWTDGDYFPDDPTPQNDYDKACKITDKDRGHGMMFNESAAVFRTGWGDGSYPVYAWRDTNSGRIVRVEIHFDEYEEPEEEPEETDTKEQGE